MYPWKAEEPFEGPTANGPTAAALRLLTLRGLFCPGFAATSATSGILQCQLQCCHSSSFFPACSSIHVCPTRASLEDGLWLCASPIRANQLAHGGPAAQPTHGPLPRGSRLRAKGPKSFTDQLTTSAQPPKVLL